MNKKNIVINLFLAFFSAGLVYGAYYWFTPLVWVAFIPIILLARRASFKEVLLPAGVVSFCAALLILYWVIDYDKVTMYLSVLYFSSFFFLFIIVSNFLFGKIKNSFAVLIPPSSWLFFFYLYSLLNTGSFCINIAILQNRFSFITQLIGEFGIVFLILLVNSLIVFLFLNKKKKTNFIVLMFIFIVLMSGYIYGHYKETEGKRVRIAVVQGNFSKDWNWRLENSRELILNKYLELSREVASEKPDLIVWPEYAIPLNLESHVDVYEKISNLAKELKINLIIGSFLVDGIALPGEDDLYFDSAFAFDRNGELAGRYDALRPFPYKTFNSAGEGYYIFESDAGRVGITVCFDELFGEVYRDYDKLGVDYFVSISNNSPVTNPLTMKWMKYFSELRAASYGKYFIRSTNTGYSQVVDPFGNVIDEIPAKQEGYMITDIYLKK